MSHRPLITKVPTPKVQAEQSNSKPPRPGDSESYGACGTGNGSRQRAQRSTPTTTPLPTPRLSSNRALRKTQPDRSASSMMDVLPFLGSGWGIILTPLHERPPPLDSSVVTAAHIQPHPQGGYLLLVAGSGLSFAEESSSATTSEVYIDAHVFLPPPSLPQDSPADEEKEDTTTSATTDRSAIERLVLEKVTSFVSFLNKQRNFRRLVREFNKDDGTLSMSYRLYSSSSTDSSYPQASRDEKAFDSDSVLTMAFNTLIQLMSDNSERGRLTEGQLQDARRKSKVSTPPPPPHHDDSTGATTGKNQQEDSSPQPSPLSSDFTFQLLKEDVTVNTAAEENHDEEEKDDENSKATLQNKLCQELFYYFLYVAVLRTRCLPYDAGNGLVPTDNVLNRCATLRKQIEDLVTTYFQEDDRQFDSIDDADEFRGFTGGSPPMSPTRSTDGRSFLQRVAHRLSIWCCCCCRRGVGSPAAAPNETDGATSLLGTEVPPGTPSSPVTPARARTRLREIRQALRLERAVQTREDVRKEIEKDASFTELCNELDASALTFSLKEDEFQTSILVSNPWVRRFQTIFAVCLCGYYLYQTIIQYSQGTLYRPTKFNLKISESVDLSSGFLFFQDYFFRVFNSTFPAVLLVREIYHEFGNVTGEQTIRRGLPQLSTGLATSYASEGEGEELSEARHNFQHFTVQIAQASTPLLTIEDHEQKLTTHILERIKANAIAATTAAARAEAKAKRLASVSAKKFSLKKISILIEMKLHSAAEILDLLFCWKMASRIFFRLIKENRVAKLLIGFLFLPWILFVLYGIIFFPIISVPILLVEYALILATRYVLPMEMKHTQIAEVKKPKSDLHLSDRDGEHHHQLNRWERKHRHQRDIQESWKTALSCKLNLDVNLLMKIGHHFIRAFHVFNLILLFTFPFDVTFLSLYGGIQRDLLYKHEPSSGEPSAAAFTSLDSWYSSIHQALVPSTEEMLRIAQFDWDGRSSRCYVEGFNGAMRWFQTLFN